MRIAMSLLSGVSYGGIPYFRNLILALAEVDKKNIIFLFKRTILYLAALQMITSSFMYAPLILA